MTTKAAVPMRTAKSSSTAPPVWLAASRRFGAPAPRPDVADAVPLPVFHFGKIPIQAKLEVGPQGDELEKEADAKAERVMRMPDPSAAPGDEAGKEDEDEKELRREKWEQLHPGDGGKVQRKCDACAAEEEGPLQRKAAGGAVTEKAAPAIVHDVLRSPGQPLDAGTRAFMEPRFGRDFSGVRVHEDARAGESARAVQAHAYTVKSDVVFAPGRYSPATSAGRRLLAHELSHVVQQSAAPAAGDVVQREAAAPPQEGPGMQSLRKLASTGLPNPGAVADVARQYPGERHEIYAFLQGTFGDAYVKAVIQAAQAKASEGLRPKDAGASAKPGGVPKGTALPSTKAKNPADNLTLNAQQFAFYEAITPPAAALRGVDKASIDLARKLQGLDQASFDAGARGSRSIGGTASLGLGPDDVAADKHVVNPDQSRSLESHQEVRSLGVTTTTDMTKKIGAPFKALTDKEKAAELKRYRKAIVDEIDAQAERLPKLEKGSADSADARAHRERMAAGGTSPWASRFDHDAEVARLKALKEEAEEATDVDGLIGIVVRNKLVVKPPERLIESTTTARSKGWSLAGLASGDALYQNNRKTTNVTVQPDGSVKTVVDGRNRAFGFNKGLDLTNSRSETGPNKKDPKKTTKTSTKAGVWGGTTDPLQAGWSRSVAHSDGSGHELGVAGKFGDGTAALSLSGKVTGGKGGRAENRSIGGSVQPIGLVQDKEGIGLSAGVDVRSDLTGHKTLSAGHYSTADGSVKVLVKENPNGSVVLTFTCAVKIKGGVHASKRAPEEPVEKGNDWAAGGSFGITHSRVVTRSRTVDKDSGAALKAELDALKPFGLEAAKLAYKRVFGVSISELCYSVPTAGEGESVNLVSETGVGADLKGSASTGEARNSRAGLGGDASFGAASITGAGETNINGKLTRRVLTGGRIGGALSLSGNVSAASLKLGVSGSDEKRMTYVFEVDAKNAALVAELRALVKPADCERFKAAHPETFRGMVVGGTETRGFTAGAGLGPLSAEGGTTQVLDSDVAYGQHIEYGPDGQPTVKHDLSGTYTGSQQNNQSFSVGGVKIAQSQQTTTARGNVDPNGQTSLDLTLDKSSSDVTKAAPKNLKQFGASRFADKVATVATSGLWGTVKKLAEDVGETSTIGAHFDPASFEALRARASDHGSWMKVAQRAPKLWLSYKAEWSQLGHDLTNPKPPDAWLAKDDSEGHIAAMQLARIKAFAIFIKTTGEAGREAIQVLRGGYGSTETALGIDVSFPPSLQSERPNFDDAANKVEHLHANLDPFIEAGNAAGGNAFLDALLAQLKDLHTKIENAPDHENVTVAVRAGAGIARMENRVRAAKSRFASAVAAKKAALLDAPAGPTAAQAATLAHQEAAANLAHTVLKQDELQARANKHVMPAAKDKEAMKKWEAAQDKLNEEADKLNRENYAQSNAAAAAKEAELKAEAEEKKAKALERIPGLEQVCTDAARKTTGVIAALHNAATSTFSGGSVESHYNAACSIINEWRRQWGTLASAYRDAGMAENRSFAPHLDAHMAQLLNDAASNWRATGSEKNMIQEVRSRLS